MKDKHAPFFKISYKTKPSGYTVANNEKQEMRDVITVICVKWLSPALNIIEIWAGIFSFPLMFTEIKV